MIELVLVLHGKQIVKRQVFTFGFLCLRLTVGTDEAGYFQFSKRQNLITTNSPSSTLTISCTFCCSLSLYSLLSLSLSPILAMALSPSLRFSLSLSLSPTLSLSLSLRQSRLRSTFFHPATVWSVQPKGRPQIPLKNLSRKFLLQAVRSLSPNSTESRRKVQKCDFEFFSTSRKKWHFFLLSKKNLLSKAAVVQFRVFFLIASFEVIFLPDSKIQFSSQSWRIEDRNSRKKFWQVIKSNFKFVVAWNKLWLTSLWPGLSGKVPQ